MGILISNRGFNFWVFKLNRFLRQNRKLRRFMFKSVYVREIGVINFSTLSDFEKNAYMAY